MHRRIVAFLGAALLIASAGAAQAGIWAWGCQGQIGNQQVIFNRSSMYLVDSKKSLGDVHKLKGTNIDALVTGESVAFEPQFDNEGLLATMTFARGDPVEDKIVLTERSSRTTSHRAGVVCGRDEETEIFRKVFRYQRDKEPEREITMQCINYQLTTRGGRSCFNVREHPVRR